METRWPGWQRENFAAKEPHREQFGVMKLPWMFIVVVVACLHLMHNWHRTELREVCFTLSLKKSPVSLWINIDMQWAVLFPRTLETSAIITNLEHSYNSTYRKASFSFPHFVWPYKGLNQRLKDCVIGPYHPSSRICVCVWEREIWEKRLLPYWDLVAEHPLALQPWTARCHQACQMPGMPWWMPWWTPCLPTARRCPVCHAPPWQHQARSSCSPSMFWRFSNR